MKDLFNLLIPQSTYKRIQHWWYERNKQWHTFIEIYLFFFRWFAVAEDAPAKCDGNDNHVGRTGRKRFVFFFFVEKGILELSLYV